MTPPAPGQPPTTLQLFALAPDGTTGHTTPAVPAWPTNTPGLWIIDARDLTHLRHHTGDPFDPDPDQPPWIISIREGLSIAMTDDPENALRIAHRLGDLPVDWTLPAHTLRSMNIAPAVHRLAANYADRNTAKPTRPEELEQLTP